MQRNNIFEKLKKASSLSNASSLDNTLIEWKKLTIEKEAIYKGLQAITHLGYLNISKNKTKVIIKEARPHYNQKIFDEAVLTKTLYSKYTVNFIGISFNNEHLVIVIERYETTLNAFLYNSLKIATLDSTDEQKSKEFKTIESTISYKQKLEWGEAISYGLQHIHDFKLVHCDITGKNIFLDKDNNIKIGDFGLTKPISHIYKEGENPEGTSAYMAPELFETSDSTNIMPSPTIASDIYSFGIILWQLITHSSPFIKLDQLSLIGEKINKKHECIPSECPPFFAKVISACWQDDPSKRPTAQSIGEQFTMELKKIPSPELSISVSTTGLFKQTSVETPLFPMTENNRHNPNSYGCCHIL